MQVIRDNSYDAPTVKGHLPRHGHDLRQLHGECESSLRNPPC